MVSDKRLVFNRALVSLNARACCEQDTRNAGRGSRARNGRSIPPI
jgi:hypothetical protein